MSIKDEAIVNIWKQPFIGDYNGLPHDAVLADKYKHLNKVGEDFMRFKHNLAKRFWDRNLEDIESDFLPKDKVITDMPIQNSVDGIPTD